MKQRSSLPLCSKCPCDLLSPMASRFSIRTLLLVVGCCSVLFAVVWVGFVEPARRALHREQQLHATLFAMQVTDVYVRDHGKWPASWDDLTACCSMENGLYKWPVDAEAIKSQVVIDFTAVLPMVVDDQATLEMAIRPQDGFESKLLRGVYLGYVKEWSE